MSNSRIMKLITGILEGVLAIPVLGGMIVIGSLYWALVIMFVLHLVTLILSVNNKEPFYGSVMGIVTSVLAWIPILGWALHLVSAILLLISAFQNKNKNQNPDIAPPQFPA